VLTEGKGMWCPGLLRDVADCGEQCLDKCLRFERRKHLPEIARSEIEDFGNQLLEARRQLRVGLAEMQTHVDRAASSALAASERAANASREAEALGAKLARIAACLREPDEIALKLIRAELCKP
jgi:hypothetical protein